MIQSHKWYFLQVGDLIIMKAGHTPPTYWPLARVSAALSKRSGLVRFVSIRPQSLLMIA